MIYRKIGHNLKIKLKTTLTIIDRNMLNAIMESSLLYLKELIE